MNNLALPYTPPELRAPVTEAQDPPWRLFLIWLGLRIMGFADSIRSDKPLGWRDHLRWKIESWGSSIFAWGHCGSLAEEEMILRGEIPFLCLDAEKQAHYRPLIPAEVLGDDLGSEIMRSANNLYDEITKLDFHPAMELLDEESAAHVKSILASSVLELRDLSREVRGI